MAGWGWENGWGRTRNENSRHSRQTNGDWKILIRMLVRIGDRHMGVFKPIAHSLACCMLDQIQANKKGWQKESRYRGNKTFQNQPLEEIPTALCLATFSMKSI